VGIVPAIAELDTTKKAATPRSVTSLLGAAVGAADRRSTAGRAGDDLSGTPPAYSLERVTPIPQKGDRQDRADARGSGYRVAWGVPFTSREGGVEIMGLFDKPTGNADGKIRELENLPIYLLRVETRDVDTMYGPGTALDLYIKTDENGTEKIYSGFAAGILRQVRDAEEGDFPVWCRIEEKELRGGKSTLILVPCEEQLSFGDPEDIPF
jgi:hypothetical protein